MIYQLGVLFLFGTCMSLTSALPPCVCTRNLKPVCGSDGQTYSNECLLECQRTKTPDLTLVRAGTCESERTACICTLEYAPVCGTDGVTYPNRCSFNCDAGKARIAYPGQCRSKREAPEIKALPPCVCTREAKPVCGTDGHTYSNPCMLNCAKDVKEDLHIDHVGHCETEELWEEEIDPAQPQCTCARNLQPVCASNGVTYGNECLMRCAGADLTVDKDEPCEAE